MNPAFEVKLSSTSSRLLGVTANLGERQVILLVLARLENEELPAYLPYDWPLTLAQIHAIEYDAGMRLPKGRVLRRMALFT